MILGLFYLQTTLLLHGSFILAVGGQSCYYVASKAKPSTDILSTAIRRSSVTCASLCGQNKCCAGYGFQKNSGNCTLLYATGKTGLQPAEDWKVFLDRSERYQICSAIEDMVSGGALNIPDSSLTASGYYIEPGCPNNDYSPRRARLNSIHIGSTCNTHKIPGCCMSGNPRWIQADLGEARVVMGVTTQGRGDLSLNQHITSYTVHYGMDGVKFQVYQEPPGIDKVFNGNYDQNTPVSNYFKCVFQARYIRIYPKTIHNGACIRFGILGCKRP